MEVAKRGRLHVGVITYLTSAICRGERQHSLSASQDVRPTKSIWRERGLVMGWMEPGVHEKFMSPGEKKKEERVSVGCTDGSREEFRVRREGKGR